MAFQYKGASFAETDAPQFVCGHDLPIWTVNLMSGKWFIVSQVTASKLVSASVFSFVTQRFGENIEGRRGNWGLNISLYPKQEQLLTLISIQNHEIWPRLENRGNCWTT